MTIAYCGFLNKQNFGDDLMMRLLEPILSDNYTHKVRFYSGDDDDKNQFAYINDDIIVIGGGNIIGPKFWILTSKHIDQLKKFNKPIVFLNVGVTNEILNLTKFCLDLKELNATWWVRSKESQQILNKIAIPSNFLPDIGFTINKQVDKHQKKISVFLNSYVLKPENDVENWISTHQKYFVLAHYFDWMAHFGWNINFYAAHTSPFVDDRIPSAIVFSMMKNKSSAKWIASSLTVDQTITSIVESDMVISMRYHPGVIALAHSIPYIDITHHSKNKTLLEDIGVHGELSVDFNNLNHQSLVKAAQSAENLHLYKDKLEIYQNLTKTLWDYFKKYWNNLLYGNSS